MSYGSPLLFLTAQSRFSVCVFVTLPLPPWLSLWRCFAVSFFGSSVHFYVRWGGFFLLLHAAVVMFALLRAFVQTNRCVVSNQMPRGTCPTLEKVELRFCRVDVLLLVLWFHFTWCFDVLVNFILCKKRGTPRALLYSYHCVLRWHSACLCY